MSNSFVIKGNICQSKNSMELDLHESAFVICVDGVSKGVFDALPAKYEGLPLYDYGDALVFPGMVDLHVHAPQYAEHLRIGQCNRFVRRSAHPLCLRPS